VTVASYTFSETNSRL